jgi:DNA-directed RNA polymerase specialized sigma24 family protein
LRESRAVLELPEFDRLVFVICVLERLSILDCALLLRKSPKDVNNAIVRATNQIASLPNRNDTELTTTSRTSIGKPRACSMKRGS